MATKTSIGNLSQFDHNTQEWEIFSSRLKQFIVLNEIKDEMKQAVLLTHLHDDTYRLLKNLVYPKKVEVVGYDELLKVLDGHFTPKRCTFADKSKFYEATRDVGESVEKWAARIRGLAVHCEFGTSLDMLLLDKFVLGLRAGKERERLFEQDVTTLTLAKAMELAQQTECAQKARADAVAVTVKQEPVYRAGAQPSTGRRDPEARTCSVCGMRSHDESRCRYKSYRCQLCGEKGHLKKVCTSKKQSKCRVNNVEATEFSAEGGDCDNCQECKLLSLRCKH
ncbi:uncharacterized protein LOC134660316 isoform X3 [Cydia amplana]|uniref:uncharacterized protein LOC134660316 isoform X3 n=1 Tax=Cydia amplana TaxID=1869771 RepID=UPI002FE5D153